jgi:hypothetical protein
MNHKTNYESEVKEEKKNEKKNERNNDCGCTLTHRMQSEDRRQYGVLYIVGNHRLHHSSTRMQILQVRRTLAVLHS